MDKRNPKRDKVARQHLFLECGMKPREKKPKTVYRIIDRKTGEAKGSYSRAYCDEYDFNNPYEARHANCHGMFEDRKNYAIAKYEVTYTLIDADCETERIT